MAALGGRAVGLIAVGILTVTLVACAPESDDAAPSPSPSSSIRPSPSPSPRPSPSPSLTPSPSPSPSIPPDVPISENSGTEWSYQAAKDLCVNWVLTRSPKNDDEVWDFTVQTPAQRYGPAWHFQFTGTFTTPEFGKIDGIVSCAVSGTPTDYRVGEAPSVGDTPPEALLYP